MAILRFDGFELDELRFELRRGATVLAVRPKVLDLLLFLARNRKRVVTKPEIFANVWPGVAVEDGSLNQAVSVIRKLIGESAIRTARGRGFQAGPDRRLGEAQHPAISATVDGLASL